MCIQPKNISIIEKNIPYIKFTGKTRAEASAFISDNLEKSKTQGRTRRVVSYSSYTPRYLPTRQSSTTTTREKSDCVLDELPAIDGVRLTIIGLRGILKAVSV